MIAGDPRRATAPGSSWTASGGAVGAHFRRRMGVTSGGISIPGLELLAVSNWRSFKNITLQALHA